METVGLGFHFEDLPIGRQFKTIGRTITDADITNFINATGMVESMFTDLEFLKTDSDIKGRVSPGALVYTFAEGLLVQSTMQHTGFAFLNMELDVKAPTFSGDTIYAWSKVIEKNKINEDIGALTMRTIASKNNSNVSFPDEKNLTENIVLDLKYSVLIPKK